MKEYETVIGLEVHVELATRTKIFCSCTTQFGGEVNTQCCPVCTGMPGTLPVLNKKVVEFAMAAGLALNCQINHKCIFDRKNYYYPDLPKAYQISQLYLPLCRDGAIEIDTNEGRKTIRIHEVHMEEDAGKLVHEAHMEEDAGKLVHEAHMEEDAEHRFHEPPQDSTLVDYNRCGIPLIEIVSEPDMSSAQEVIAYLEKLRLILQYLGVSDCKMQEGSLRADINLSVREAGAREYGTRTEMKNMNSFKAIARAIDEERKRQIEVIESGNKVIQETRRWDDNKNASFSMRSKEEAQDYRYFPEPDLPPIHISEEWIQAIKTKQPELRDEKQTRFIKEYDIPQYDASIITSSKHLADLFEDTAKLCETPKEVSNWLMVEGMRLLKEQEMEPEDITLSPTNLARLIEMVNKGSINRTIAKEVFEKIFINDIDPVSYVNEHGLSIIADDAIIRVAIERVIGANAQSITDYNNGKDRALGYLVGQSMKELKGKADPVMVNRIIMELLTSVTSVNNVL